MSNDSQQALQPQASNSRRVVLGVCLLLAALVVMVYGQAEGFDFVNYDDAENVSANPNVAAGLSWRGIAWAFTHSQVGRWAPLTTISHMADCQFYGMRPGGHHLTNVALHAAVAVLLFLALCSMTGALWRCAFVAAVFAVHPLGAEVVGWVSERGDLLAGIFFMLVLLAYARHARAPARGAWYWGVVALFALGLMCKPTIVTLPVVLLLLDYWPLERFTRLNGEETWLGIPKRLIVEKIPLFALAALSCAAAALAQMSAQTPIENLSFLSRIANALVSCVIYARQMIWPVGLAVFYPHPRESLALWDVDGALLLIAIVSAAVYAGRRRFPWASLGWCWYLVMLAPMLGIVETGAQAHADRYAYFPQIGLHVMAAWGITGLSEKWNNRREILGAGAAVAIVLLALRANDQASCWRDSITLWNNAVESTGPNSVAETNLGTALMHAGRMDGALLHLGKALEIEPGLAEAHVSMGNALLQNGSRDLAIAQYRRALELQPRLAKAHIDLGVALQQAGRIFEAVTEYQRALEINPDLAAAHNNLGEALRQSGDLDDAIGHFRRAVELDPGYESARDNLSLALRQKEQAQGGIPH